MNHMVTIFVSCIIGYVMLGLISLAVMITAMAIRWCRESGLCIDCFDDVLREFNEWLHDNDMTKKEISRNAIVYVVAWPRELPSRLNQYDAMFKEWFSDWRKERNI